MIRPILAGRKAWMLLIFIVFFIFCGSDALADDPPEGWVAFGPGLFTMGSPHVDESPAHEVELTYAFYMSPKEVTREQWVAVMGTTPWLNADGTPRNDVHGWTGTAAGDTYPATYITWGSAMNFARAMNGGSNTGHFRLPLEAEWEFACRAGSAEEDPFSLGITNETIGDYAWTVDNTWPNEPWPHMTGSKLASPHGNLFDIHGNVLEWCVDWFGAYSSPAQVDPLGPTTGTLKVTRGGYYLHKANALDEGAQTAAMDARSASRYAYAPLAELPEQGLRLIWTEAIGPVNPVNPDSGGGGTTPKVRSSSAEGGGGGGCFLKALFSAK